MVPPRQATRNLVILRAGNHSLHREWIAAPNRDFDLFISYYGQEDKKYAADCEYHEVRPGPKWPCIKELLTAHSDLIHRYDCFWFPDDDISVGTQTINRLFSFFRAFELSLAQPALTPDSYYSWPQLIQRQNTALRYVDFVELMVPMFSRHALQACLKTFDQNRSGWGLDWVWPKLIGNRDKKAIAIIDATPVKHTRPLGGELYKNNPDMNPRTEAKKIFTHYGIEENDPEVRYVNYGSICFNKPTPVERLLMATKAANRRRKNKRATRKASKQN